MLLTHSSLDLSTRHRLHTFSQKLVCDYGEFFNFFPKMILAMELPKIEDVDAGVE
jgi:hypothetical protein